MKPSRHETSDIWTRVCPGKSKMHGSGWELGQGQGYHASLLPQPTRAGCHAICKWGPSLGNGDRAARHKCSPPNRDSKTQHPHYCKQVQVGEEAMCTSHPHLPPSVPQFHQDDLGPAPSPAPGLLGMVGLEDSPGPSRQLQTGVSSGSRTRRARDRSPGCWRQMFPSPSPPSAVALLIHQLNSSPHHGWVM